jgi:sugar phosphate isomerase/epimerase
MTAMDKLAFSTNAFKKHTLEQAIDAIAAIGYRGVELMADMHHAYPPVMDEPRRRAIQKLIADRGLSVSNVNAFTLFAMGDTYHPTWIENDECKRDTRVTHTLACVEMAASFGARTISLQPGGPLIGTNMTRDTAGERFAEGLSLVLPMARQHEMILAIEPEPGLYIETSREYMEFRDRYFADEPLVRMNCDIGHLYCVGEDPAAVIREMPEQIAHVHLEDIGENRVHQHLTPGKGAIDFGAIFAALRDVAYGGWVTVELYPYETTAAGVAQAAWDHLRSLV